MVSCLGMLELRAEAMPLQVKLMPHLIDDVVHVSSVLAPVRNSLTLKLEA